MITFDQAIPKLQAILEQHIDDVNRIRPILINRDLYGRISLVVDSTHRDNDIVKTLAEELHKELVPYTFPAERVVLDERDLKIFIENERAVPLGGDLTEIYIKDRLAMEGDWGDVKEETEGPPRIVFYSMKGGVGRSTALAVTAWALAERGLRVMALDLDLESPGLSASLLPEDRRPLFGIVDWLVEDLVGNQEAVFGAMVATSELSRNGEILVVPAHGADPGEYISKLGRIWMPKAVEGDGWEPWFRRLDRLLKELESKWAPDVILIDSRAGLDEIASTCLTDLGASLVLLFAVDVDQTWSGYQLLFRYWRRVGVVEKIRERLQHVGAMIPDTNTLDYLADLRERAWDLFIEELYDEISPEAVGQELWNFDLSDESAPHWPWRVNWNQGFAALRSVHGQIHDIDKSLVAAVFGDLLEGVISMIDKENVS